MGVVALVLVVVVGVLAFRYFSRPHTVVVVADGAARVLRGTPPHGLVADLDDVARSTPTLAGEVRVSGSGTSVTVDVRGFEEPAAQRVRNVVGLHRSRLR